MIVHGIVSSIYAWQWEDEDELKRIREEDRELQNQFIDVLISRGKISREELKKMMKEEAKLSAEMAVNFGLADEIF